MAAERYNPWTQKWESDQPKVAPPPEKVPGSIPTQPARPEPPRGLGTHAERHRRRQSAAMRRVKP